MTQAKHTQGKWRVGSCSNHVMCGDIIVAVPNTDSSGGDVVLTYAEQKANAELISAAPEMLYALQRFIEKCTRWNHDDPELQRAKAAIKKATGA